jgi:hypothetical protein
MIVTLWAHGLKTAANTELDALTRLYVSRGLSPDLARSQPS